MYQLTLTPDERKAIEWTGDCYWNGNDLYDLLFRCENEFDNEWDSDANVKFLIPESVAWDIKQLYKENDESFSYFASTLVVKLNSLISSIV